jgi:hypothetical protein
MASKDDVEVLQFVLKWRVLFRFWDKTGPYVLLGIAVSFSFFRQFELHLVCRSGQLQTLTTVGRLVCAITYHYVQAYGLWSFVSDGDGDGVVDFAGAFLDLDKNGDGQLGLDDVHNAIDNDSDGVLSASEVAWSGAVYLLFPGIICGLVIRTVQCSWPKTN